MPRGWKRVKVASTSPKPDAAVQRRCAHARNMLWTKQTILPSVSPRNTKFAQRRAVGSELVGHDAGWSDAVLLQEFSHQLERRLAVSPWLNQDVQDLAFAVHGTYDGSESRSRPRLIYPAANQQGCATVPFQFAQAERETVKLQRRAVAESCDIRTIKGQPAL